MSESQFETAREYLRRAVQAVEWIEQILADPQAALESYHLSAEEAEKLRSEFAGRLAEKRETLQAILDQLPGGQPRIQYVAWQPDAIRPGYEYGAGSISVSGRLTGEIASSGVTGSGKSRVVAVRAERKDETRVIQPDRIKIRGDEIDLTFYDVGPIKDWNITGILVDRIDEVGPIKDWPKPRPGDDSDLTGDLDLG